jgi:hypothetical protein
VSPSEEDRLSLVRRVASDERDDEQRRRTSRQTVELAVAAEELGIDGAFVRVHHFSPHLSTPFPLLAAIGVRTSRGKAVCAADTVLLTVPSQLGVSTARRCSKRSPARIAPAFGWAPKTLAAAAA